METAPARGGALRPVLGGRDLPAGHCRGHGVES
jgi:hypothetical protein